jgi:dipeptidyl aminopeptidase/acylaminoacyl peptidase
MRRFKLAALLGLLLVSAAATSTEPVADDAALFGTLERAFSAELSADGKRMVYVGYGGGTSSIGVVVDLVNPSATQIARGDGKPTRLSDCEFSAADRLVCSLGALVRKYDLILPMQRMIAMDADGGKHIELGEGAIDDWLNGVDGAVLMTRSDGSVGRIDTRTNKWKEVEKPGAPVYGYVSDGLGNIRIMIHTTWSSMTGALRGFYKHFYRLPNDRQWRPLGTYDSTGKGSGIWPLAVDPTLNAAYVAQKLDGRDALYRLALDGTLKSELVYASKEVDVDGVVTVGRNGRVIGASYTTDRERVEYFDPTYKRLHAMLEKALPQMPLIDIVSASADEQTLLIRAGSDVDPGTWYLFDRAKKSLAEIMTQRPGLKLRTLSPVKVINFAAGDGTQIPAYLTLPPGVTDAKNLPAIVMPHGGPAARDAWGFDWLAQFYAQRGFVVLQPNYRGSAGYGDAWFVENGFKSWKTSIGDISDGGRWLVKQGIAHPSKLAVVGWSYGGYAALQANVLDADLFKAVVAIAPVTDLALLKIQATRYTNWKLVGDFVGNGPHITEGSPMKNAQAFKAPVLMFHGDMDLNVDIEQARRMDKALREAGKSSTLVEYPELDHSLPDETARADMLRKSEAFLRQHLKL